MISIRPMRVLVLLAFVLAFNLSAADRLRLIVETDAGGDPDDEQSLVRFLLYSNEWDIEGIIANRPHARDGENRNSERTGLGIVRRLVNAYADCYPNLVHHDPRFPEPDLLRSRVVPGYGHVRDGVDLIVNAVDSQDPRPIWFMNWGTDDGSAPGCLKRALDEMHQKRGSEGYAKFKKRLHLSSADKFGDHTMKIDPPFPFWIDTFRPPLKGKRWYHRFSDLTAKAGGFDITRDVLVGHGPLGALYPTNTTHWLKEGDSMSFLYLVPTGMNDPAQPGWGSWAGRYGPQENVGTKPYFWANQLDHWNGATNRDNTLLRWAAHLQNDFRARLDWCVKPINEANHRPVAVLNNRSGSDILRISARPGSRLTLSAEGSNDPDSDRLRYHWEYYREPGTFRGVLQLPETNTKELIVMVPQEARGNQIHILLTVEDSGSPPLVAYRRAIIEVQ